MCVAAQLEPLCEQSTALTYYFVVSLQHIERNTNSTTELKIKTDTLFR